MPYYTFDDVAKIFHKDIRFAKRLKEKGLPIINMGGTKRILKSKFWDWIGVNEPDDPYNFFVTVPEIKSSFGLTKTAAYKFKDSIPSNLTFRIGNLIFIDRNGFYEWLEDNNA